MEKVKNLKNKLYSAAVISSASIVDFLVHPIAVFAQGTTTDNNDGVLNYDAGTGNYNGTTNNIAEAGNKMSDQGRHIYYIVVAVSLIVVLANFVLKAVKLSKSGDNPSAKQSAQSGLIVAAIAVALIGGAGVISGWMFGVFRS